jgi:phosphatidylcholine synthase
MAKGGKGAESPGGLRRGGCRQKDVWQAANSAILPTGEETAMATALRPDIESTPGPGAPEPPVRRATALQQLLGWLVHLYTALGLVAAAGIAVLTLRGGAEVLRDIFLLMLVATVIDSTDGVLARRARVREVVPGFDGRRLDDLTDFLTYAVLPLLLLYRLDIPHGFTTWLLCPLLASAYGFCQSSIKTTDGYFLGFPSYWNVVAFYLCALHPVTPELALGVILLASLLTFVPSRYFYPTQPGRLNRLTCVLAVLWGILTLGALGTWAAAPPSPGCFASDTARSLARLSMLFPIYYMVASWALSLWLWWRAARAVPPATSRGAGA